MREAESDVRLREQGWWCLYSSEGLPGVGTLFLMSPFAHVPASCVGAQIPLIWDPKHSTPPWKILGCWINSNYWGWIGKWGFWLNMSRGTGKSLAVQLSYWVIVIGHIWWATMVGMFVLELVWLADDHSLDLFEAFMTLIWKKIDDSTVGFLFSVMTYGVAQAGVFRAATTKLISLSASGLRPRFIITAANFKIQAELT